MVDYYQIVQRAVAALDPDTEASRQALYDRARAALAAQLCLKNPPLPNDSIRAELVALDDAIKKVESEAWSKRYEINVERKIAVDEKGGGTPKRNAVFRVLSAALMLGAVAAYFILWMTLTGLGSKTTAVVLLLVFALPLVCVFIFVIYPILSPLLRLLRWLNKKLLQRPLGGEIAANAAGATVLSAALSPIGAFKAPDLFSWWAAGWCWIGCVFLLTLDPDIVNNLRAWLKRVQSRKATPPKGEKTPSNEEVSPNEAISPPETDRQVQGVDPPNTLALLPGGSFEV
jgi:hypothetical protein